MFFIDSAPIAKIDFDEFSNPGKSSQGSFTSLKSGSSTGHRRTNSDILDSQLDANIALSLENLISNFDDSLTEHYHPLKNNANNTNPQRDLERIKSLWEIAEKNVDKDFEQYPLQKPIKILDLNNVSDFDLDDVDAFSEDLEEPGIVNLISSDMEENFEDEVIDVVYKSEILDPTAKPEESLEVSINRYKQFRNNYPSFLKINVDNMNSWINDLYSLPKDMIKIYLSDLKCTVKSYSDVLVEYLALREELIMIREHLDEFVFLMNQVHNRRKIAAKAALENISDIDNKLRTRKETKRRETMGPKTNFSSREMSDLEHLSSSLSKLREKFNLRSSLMGFDFNRSLSTQNLYPSNNSVQLRLINKDPEAGDFDSSKLKAILDEEIVGNAITNQRKMKKRISSTCDNSAESFLGWPNNKPILSHSLGVRIPLESIQKILEKSKDQENSNGIVYGSQFCYHIRLINIILKGVLVESPKVPFLVSDYTQNYSTKEKVESSVKKSRVRSKSRARYLYQCTYSKRDNSLKITMDSGSHKPTSFS